jgi:hypothetical protein
MSFAGPEHRRVLGVAADAPLATWYDLLGISPSASREDVEQAMLRRMVQVRKYQVGAYQMQALQLMSDLGQAYVTLSNPQARAAYDRSLSALAGADQTVEDVAAEVLAEAGRQRVRVPLVDTSTPKPLPQKRPLPATLPQTAAPADPDRPPCPQCGKPMPKASAVCMHCGFKRARGSSVKPPPRAEAEAPLAGLSDAAISDLLRLNLSPEQTLARLQLMSNLYHAQRDGGAYWTSAPPMFCSFCRHPLALRTDAHALSAESLAGYEMYVTYFVKKREAQGKLKVAWPLSPADLTRVTDAICGGNPQAMRVFCRTCAERILASPRMQESSC